jgi:hypothetical protein
VAVRLGSGKSGWPSDRMHSANLSACWRWLADMAGANPSFGTKPRHARWAERNAGDRVSLEPIAILPLESGSGKSDTPCARMHRASWRPGLTLEAVVLELLDDPHAASERPTAARTAIVIAHLRVPALRMWA